MLNRMDINQLADCFLKPVSAGIANILMFQMHDSRPSRFQFQFDGIFRDASIWINGFYVGNNISGYIGVAYDITDFIKFDHDNVLVVRVDATQYEGWFYEGAGIYRHVWLNQYDNIHIARRRFVRSY